MKDATRTNASTALATIEGLTDLGAADARSLNGGASMDPLPVSMDPLPATCRLLAFSKAKNQSRR